MACWTISPSSLSQLKTFVFVGDVPACYVWLHAILIIDPHYIPFCTHWQFLMIKPPLYQRRVCGFVWKLCTPQIHCLIIISFYLSGKSYRSKSHFLNKAMSMWTCTTYPQLETGCSANLDARGSMVFGVPNFAQLWKLGGTIYWLCCWMMQDTGRYAERYTGRYPGW